jgi:hypothetical protein
LATRRKAGILFVQLKGATMLLLAEIGDFRIKATGNVLTLELMGLDGSTTITAVVQDDDENAIAAMFAALLWADDDTDTDITVWLERLKTKLGDDAKIFLRK